MRCFFILQLKECFPNCPNRYCTQCKVFRNSQIPLLASTCNLSTLIFYNFPFVGLNFEKPNGITCYSSSLGTTGLEGLVWDLHIFGLFLGQVLDGVSSAWATLVMNFELFHCLLHALFSLRLKENQILPLPWKFDICSWDNYFCLFLW